MKHKMNNYVEVQKHNRETEIKNTFQVFHELANVNMVLGHSNSWLVLQVSQAHLIQGNKVLIEHSFLPSHNVLS